MSAGLLRGSANCDRDRAAGGVSRPAGLALHFHELLRASGAALPLWGAGVFQRLRRCSWVSLATSGGSGPLLPGVSQLRDHILLLKSSRGALRICLRVHQVCWAVTLPVIWDGRGQSGTGAGGHRSRFTRLRVDTVHIQVIQERGEASN